MKINCTPDVKDMLHYSGIFKIGFFHMSALGM